MLADWRQYAADLRRLLTPQDLTRAPRLAAALKACDALFEELGWQRLGAARDV